jgi:hypothetical protein
VIYGAVLALAGLAAWVIAKRELGRLRRCAAELVPVPARSAVMAPREPAVRPRPPRRCGYCRLPGHTRTTCPERTGLQTLPDVGTGQPLAPDSPRTASSIAAESCSTGST